MELRSPTFDRESLHIPPGAANLSKPFNGSVCSAAGDEYEIKENIINLLGDKNPAESIALATNHWSLTAGSYESLWRKRALSFLSGEDFPIERECEFLLKKMQPKSGQVILDVGASTGLYSRMIKKACSDCTVVAVDFSTPMLLEAGKKAKEEKTDLFLLRANAENLPFFAKSIDSAMMGGTLNELKKPRKVLYEIYRVLKPESLFFVMHLLKADTWYQRWAQEAMALGGVTFRTQKESNTLFEQTGFNIRHQERAGIVCFTLLQV